MEIPHIPNWTTYRQLWGILVKGLFLDYFTIDLSSPLW
jgi:hypothetical protein